MKFTVLLFVNLLFISFAQAQPISSLRDWTAEKDVMTVLGKEGCVAETVYSEVTANGNTKQWHLQVLKLKSNNGEYSSPLVIAFPEMDYSEEYYEASAQSDRAGTPTYSMTLLQPENQNIFPVGSRITDRVEIIRRLRQDNKFFVDFLTKDSSFLKVAYSLSGSSKTINDMDSVCQ